MHAQGVKQSVSVIVVIVSTKIARSCILGICACCKVDIGENLNWLVYTLRIAQENFYAGEPGARLGLASKFATYKLAAAIVPRV